MQAVTQRGVEALVVLDRSVERAEEAAAVELQRPRAGVVDREPLARARLVIPVHHGHRVEANRNPASRARTQAAVEWVRMELAVQIVVQTNSMANVLRSGTAVNLVLATSSVIERITPSAVSKPAFRSARAAVAAGLTFEVVASR